LDLDFLKAEYDAEWQRRDQLQAAASIPLAVLTVLGSAIVYLLQAFDSESAWLVAAFWISVTVAGAAYGVAVYMLVRSYFGYMYRRIPLPSQLVAYESAIREYLAAGGKASGLALRADLNDHLSRAYVAATDRNAVNNINRGHYLHKANAASVVALVFAVLAAAPFAIEQRSSVGKPSDLILHQAGDMSKTNDKQQTPQTKPTEQKPANPPAERPRFPDNLDVRTGTQEPKKK
jgi:hypothetical protein